jgi:hypothetical protein
MRRLFGDDLTYYHHFERLHEELRQVTAKKRGNCAAKTEKDLEDFVEFELGRVKFLQSAQLQTGML